MHALWCLRTSLPRHELRRLHPDSRCNQFGAFKWLGLKSSRRMFEECASFEALAKNWRKNVYEFLKSMHGRDDGNIGHRITDVRTLMHR